MKLGVVTSIAIIAHEIRRKSAISWCCCIRASASAGAPVEPLPGLAAVVGALLAYFALSHVSGWIPEILAFAAASMIYVAVADLIPGLQKRTAVRESLTQVAFIALGIASIWVIHAVLFPEI